MRPVGTGAMLANQKLIAICVIGDGDTGAIGIAIRALDARNCRSSTHRRQRVCYGLTKGQFSPTADLGSKRRTGSVTTCTDRHLRVAIQLGATLSTGFVLGRQEQKLAAC